MPWESKAQQGWGHTPAGKKALGGAKKVKEWDAATNFKSLPEKKASERKKSQKAHMRDVLR